MTARRPTKSLKALIATGLFENVNISQNGGVVTVSLTESPIINQVAFEGNKEIKDDTLAPEVQLKARSVFSRAKVQADVQRILDVYRRSGYYAVQVDAQIIQLDNDRVNLAFVIQEGSETKVLSINFIGNHAFSDFAAPRRRHDHRNQFPELPQIHRRLRSGPPQSRPRSCCAAIT